MRTTKAHLACSYIAVLAALACAPVMVHFVFQRLYELRQKRGKEPGRHFCNLVHGGGAHTCDKERGRGEPAGGGVARRLRSNV